MSVTVRANSTRNKILQEIGPFVKKTIEAAYKKKNIPCSVKYIDPSYMIR